MNTNQCGNYKTKDLFEQDLKIPEYQRPYSWEKKQVIALIKDLLNAFKKNKIQYLLGNIILYESTSVIEIVDGQQRITTIALILKTLGSDVKFLEEKISVLSTKRLQENYKVIQNYFKEFTTQEQKFKDFLENKVIVTYIKTKSLDEAFILFDSQNTRGKALKRKDILKVHHIHPISKGRELYAKKWEEWEKEKITQDYDKLDEMLFYLTFIRKAIKNDLQIEHLVDIDVFEELQTKSHSYKLNNYNQPPIYEKFDFDFKTNELTLITRYLQYNKNNIVDGIKYLPFEINSSIASGESFFSYIWKYKEAFKNIEKEPPFKQLDNVYGSGNNFLKIIYKSALFFYYDKFGSINFEEFSKKVFILLAYLRVIKNSIRKEKVLSYEWNDNEKLNIFNLISLSYSSREIIEQIDEYIQFHILLENFKDTLSGTKANFFKWDKDEIKEITLKVKNG
jgi:hypothetical protein